MKQLKDYEYYRTDLGVLYYGDCLEVLPLIENKTIDCCITSPPYPGNEKMWGELYKAENFYEAHKYLEKIWHQFKFKIKDGCKLIINMANTKRRPYLPNIAKLYETVHSNWFEPMGEIIWHKGYGQLGTAWGSYCNPSDPSLADQHEYIVIFRHYGERKKQKGYKISARDFKSWRNSIWQIAPAKASKLNHVAPFPIEIPQRLIILYTYENEIVLDPFFGSGTTAVACERLNRRWIGIEISEKYCEIAKQRIKAEADQIKLL